MPGLPFHARILRFHSALAACVITAAGSPAGWLGASSALAQESQIVAIPGAASALDLKDCLELARAENASLQAERARRGELDALMTQARSEGLPSLDAIASWNRSRDPSFALDSSFSGDTDLSGADSLGFGFVLDPDQIPAQTFWRASLNANWELRPTRLWNAVTAAKLGVQRQDISVREAEHNTAVSVMDAYYRVILASEQLEAVESELTSREEFLEISRRRLRVEMGTALDTLQAAVSLANLLPQRHRAEQTLRNTGSELNMLLGRDPLEPISIERALEIETSPIEPAALTRFVQERPDVQQIGVWEKILRKNRGAQKSMHRPYLSMEGSYGYVGREIDTITEEGHDFWSARVALSVPLFDGLLTRGQVKETEAAIRRTQLEALDVRRQAELEILAVAGDLQASRSTLAAAELNEARAADALRQMTLRYELGKAEYLDVLNAEYDRFAARSNVIQAKYDVLRLTASLKRALGVSPEQPLSIILEEPTTP